MPSYNVKQIAYTDAQTCVGNPLDLVVEDIQGSAQAGEDFRVAPYQQIVIHPQATGGDFFFNPNETYYLSLTIPKNQNYDLQYAIKLIEYQDTGDLDSLNYQFVRYITSRKVSDGESDNSRVVLFQEKARADDPEAEGKDAPVYVGDIKIVVAEVIPPTTTDSALLLTNDEHYEYKAQTMYYHPIKELYYWCTNPSRPWPHIYTSTGIELISSTDLEWSTDVPGVNGWRAIGKNDVLLSHSWIINESDYNDTFNIIFKPRVSGLSAIYLHLIPIPEDNDIQWQNSQSGASSNYYGRHIDLENLHVSLYKINNLLGGVTARRIGIWGHPGLMFDVEGEEIKIGPSGYYELHDFTVNELGVAAFGPQDRFTIDVQYN